jgi:hypothetical protein
MIVLFLVVAGLAIGLIALKLTKLAVIFAVVAIALLLAARSGIFRKNRKRG